MVVKVKATKSEWLRRKKFRIVMAKLVVAGVKSLDEGVQSTKANETDFVLSVLDKAANEVLVLQLQDTAPRATRERLGNLIEDCLERLD